ncbi:DUF190 domain-containing protein [Deinococcus detaillensis]|uniref:DUF190 domain-containing protein n=1 Tax=Deinococcus detaillensis TaxID=2592048 RepID=A0A553UZ74_9DEIO|nr:DUF190 domain-containing protein [Deinococcus detaillensis]TSA85524.1 DUF190 domain-containing protein [Deinococcus detaillensis]
MTWTDAALLKIHLGATDQVRGESTFDWLIQAARQAGLKGATVTQGSMGFGLDGELRHASLFHFAQNLPVVVEIVDEEDKIQRFLEGVQAELTASALITVQRVRLLARSEVVP